MDPGRGERGRTQPDFRVIVVRAWREVGGLRIRLLADHSPERDRVVGSIPDACDVLASLLAELLVAPQTGDAAETPD